ncbi:hypothetical protein J6590_066477 [Homalodisca vitripennis]|nr:hypothetical protein J6590_066477 [Homalodisca vitripennis]
MMVVRYTKLGVFLDYDCNFNKNVLFESSEWRMLNESYIWLIVSLQKDVLKEMTFLNLGLTSDVSLALPGFILYDLYKVNYSSPLVTDIAAEWNLSTGFKIKLNNTKVNLRSDFHGIRLRGTVVLTKLKTNSSNAEERILDTNILPHLDSVSRFTYILFLNLQDLYNFTFDFEVTESWGYLNPQGGGHDGMVGQLERGEIELGLTPATMFKHRMDTVDFTAPVWKFRTCFIFRHPDSFGVYKALVTPLSPTVWISTGVLCLLVVGTLRLIHQYEVTGWPDTELSWSASAILVVGALSQQGLASTSRRVSVRILCLFLLLLSVVLYAFYGAAIVTSLLTPPARTIHTIRQLLDSPIGMGVENTAYTRDYFSKSTDALTADLYRRKLQNSYGFMDVPSGIEMMRTKKYAFYAEDATLYLPIDKTFNNIEKCSLTEIELFPPYLVSTPVQKTSPFRDFISCGFNLMRERGILYRENKVWHPQRPQCIGDRRVARVDLESVMLAFVILAAGIVSSVVILIVERTVAKISQLYS